ncbi:type II toxin-antitoxin system HicB family antitoxin [Phyllobacterium leguminum]|uniref:Putative HicB family RNase H-like nuclease n=1 Tax=Phyllobacterium leguminum TaxID=314237 RepID=A0A318T6D2_9HYPH|nr:type II toxin-antitoxin system HicB family antitoxin [Phyllobacterium leguminum]PYE89954.1 putative HicB family RNase H-like nuclease [Phyllobacterium leguminum]
MKTLHYRGYQGAVEFEDGHLFVRVLHVDDVLVAQFDNAGEAHKIFRELVDGYLADCTEFGREPNKPFKGSFNIRIPPELHRRVAILSAESGISLNTWVSEAISEKAGQQSHH